MVRIARASTIATFLIAALVPASLAAQHYGTAGDVAEFANALNDHRYSDIAKEVVKTAITNGVQDPEGVLASALCEISATEAIRTADVTQRLLKLKESVAAYEDYLKKFPSGEKAAIARLKLSEWLRTAGETVAAQLKKESVPEKKEALKNDGLNFFTKAEVLSKARIEEIARVPKDKMTELQQAELFALKFTVARMPYSKALLHENRTGVEASSFLNEALNQLEELDLDLPMGHPLSFEGRRIVALIYIEQGKLKDAEELLTFSCDQLAQAVAEAPDIVKDFPDNQVTRDLIAGMFLEKADFLTKTKKPADWKGALDTTEKLLKVIPDVVKTRDGKQAMIILAEALDQEGQAPKARTIAQQVYDADPSGDAGLKAREMLDKLVGSGGSGGSGVESLLKLLQGCVERRDITQGERMAARILAHAEAKAKPELQADALLQLGGLYFNSGLYLYSAVVFSTVAEEYPTSARAPEAKFNEAMSYAKQGALDGRASVKYWKTRSTGARDELIKKFGGSKEAADVSMFAADDAKAEERYPEALDLYLKVPTTSPRYGEAQYDAAIIALTLGDQAKTRAKLDDAKKRYQTAETSLKTAIQTFETNVKNTVNPSELARIKDSLFGARMTLARVYIMPEISKAKDAEKLVDDVEAEVKNDKTRLEKVWGLRIRVFTAQGRGREIVKILDEQGDVQSAETFLTVASQLDGQAREKTAANEKDPTIVEDLKDAARLYSKGIDKAGAGVAQKTDFGLIGQRLLLIVSQISGLPDDLSLMPLLPPAPAIAEKDAIDRVRKAFDLAPATAEVDVDRQRAIAFAAAATGNWLDAVTALRDVADKLPLFDEKTGKVNREIAQKNARLPDVFQNLAVAYIGAAKGEKAHTDSAKQILIRLIVSADPKSKRYWEARYLHLLALKEGKDYAELESTLDNLARTAPDADGNKYGIKSKIDDIRAWSKKIINK